MKLPAEIDKEHAVSDDDKVLVESIVRHCAKVSSMYSINKNQIHPDISVDQMSDSAMTVYHSTCQCVAEAILREFGLS